MAFFDNIGKKISDLGQGAMTKTRDLADSARTSAAISDEERKINSYYSQLGRLYYAKCADSADGEFLNIVNMIKDSNRRIEELRAENRARKGLVKCPKCGAENTVDSVFCCACGNRMEFQATTPSGGTENVSSEEVTGQSAEIVPDEETGHIEADVSTEEHSDNEPAADETIQEVAAEANEVPVQRVCSSCGAPLNEGAVFCGSCGTRQ